MVFQIKAGTFYNISFSMILLFLHQTFIFYHFMTCNCILFCSQRERESYIRTQGDGGLPEMALLYTHTQRESDINQQTQWDSNQIHIMQLGLAFFHLRGWKNSISPCKEAEIKKRGKLLRQEREVRHWGWVKRGKQNDGNKERFKEGWHRKAVSGWKSLNERVKWVKSIHRWRIMKVSLI